jgi:hypothetical protein
MMKVFFRLVLFLALAASATAQVRVVVPQTLSAPAPVRIQVPRVQVVPVQPVLPNTAVPNNLLPYNQRLLNSELTPPSSILTQPVVPQTPAQNELRLGATNPSPRFGTDQRARYDPRYSNQLVRSLQSELRRLGYYTGAVDGIFGPASQSALTQYQRRLGFAPSGVIDQQTLATLGIIQ